MKKKNAVALSCLLTIAGRTMHAMDAGDGAKGEQSELKREAFNLYCAGNYRAAVERFEALDPATLGNNDWANFGQALMALGDYKRGMACFESRLDPERKAMLSTRLTPDLLRAWHAQAKDKALPLAGRTIAVINEPGTGFGDWFTFAGYAEQLKKAGAKKVIFQVPGPIKDMMTGQAGADEVYSTKEVLPKTDAQLFPMSLPALVSKKGLRPVYTVEDLQREGYMGASAEEVQKWREELQGAVPIGICWKFSGNAVPGGRFMQRGLPVQAFAALHAQLKDRNVRLINLDGATILSPQEFEALPQDQKEGRASDTTSLKNNVLYADAPLSFKRVAALLAYARSVGGHVVSVDTGGACAAAAAGVSTHTLVRGPENTDARWGTVGNGTECRLFRSVQMYNVPSPEATEPVMRAIAERIKATLPAAALPR